jgi:hypothetical protein
MTGIYKKKLKNIEVFSAKSNLPKIPSFDRLRPFSQPKCVAQFCFVYFFTLP